MSTDKLVRAIAQKPENRRCFDCGNLGSYSVVPSLSIFVCMDCSGRHIKCGQRAKNLSMSNFTPAEISALDAGGNAVAASTWLAKWKPEGGAISRPVPKSLSQIDAWIQAVFVEKRYYSAIPAAAAAASGQRGGDSEQIPVRPLSDVLGGDPGAIKLTVSPTPSGPGSPSAPSHSTASEARGPSARPASATQAAPPPLPQPRISSSGVPVSSTAAGQPAQAASKPATLSSAFAAPAASAVAAAAASSSYSSAAFAALGFTDNAFGFPSPPPPPAPAFVSMPGASSSSPPSRHPPASVSTIDAATGASSHTFDPFGSIIPPVLSGPLPVAAPAAAAAVPAAPEEPPALKPPSAAEWPAGPLTATWGGDPRTTSPPQQQQQVRGPSTGGSNTAAGGASNRSSGGGAAAAARLLPPPPPPARRPSTSPWTQPPLAAVAASGWPTGSGAASGFNDDADWGAFAGAPPAAASQTHPPAVHFPRHATSPQQHAPTQQLQLHPAPQQQPGAPATAAMTTSASSRGASGGGAPVGAAQLQPPPHLQAAPHPQAPPPSRRAELPSDLFSEPVVPRPMGMGVGVGGFRPLMGPQPHQSLPDMLMPGQPGPMLFPGPGMAHGAGVVPFSFPGQPAAGLPPGMAVGVGGMMAPPGMLGTLPGMGLAQQASMRGSFAYAGQPGEVMRGMVAAPAGGGFGEAGGSLAQMQDAFSFGQMGTALPQPSETSPRQQVRDTGGNPFA